MLEYHNDNTQNILACRWHLSSIAYIIRMWTCPCFPARQPGATNSYFYFFGTHHTTYAKADNPEHKTPNVNTYQDEWWRIHLPGATAGAVCLWFNQS
jgi:hypothetical protein